MFVPIAAAVALLLSGAARADTAPRQPTSKWLVEFADNECLLSRSYGSDSNPLILTLEQTPMEQGIALYILKPSNRQDINNGRAQVSFGAESTDAKFGAHLLAERPLRRILVAVPDASYKAAAKSEVISVSVPGEAKESFSVPGLGAALEVMDQCVVDLGKHWGISAEEQRRVAKPAKPLKPLGRYFSALDYPTKALKDDAMGRTNVRIAVDETGRPTDCIVMKPSGNKALDSETCRILIQKARFEPAIDVDGRPMKSVVVTAVNWLIG